MPASIARLDIETWRVAYAGVLSTPYLVGLSEWRREAGWRGLILREPRDVRVAADAHGAILGFGSCGPSRGERDFAGEVFTLYVGPDWQNRGIGRRLLMALFRRLVATGRNSAIVWVLRDNPCRFSMSASADGRRPKLTGCRRLGSRQSPMGGPTCRLFSLRYRAKTASPSREPRPR